MPGLFGLAGLGTPLSMLQRAGDAQRIVKGILQSLIGDGARPSPLAVVRGLDDISNAVCRVADCAELCRYVHPNAQFRDAATQASYAMGSLIQELNVNERLYTVARDAVRSPGFAALSAEQQQVGRDLVREFELNGAHLHDAQRAELFEKQMAIDRLGAEFLTNLGKPVEVANVPLQYMALLGDTQRTESGALLVQNRALRQGLARVGEAKVRETLHRASTTSVPENLPVIEQLLAARRARAQQLSFRSFAELTASGGSMLTPPMVGQQLEDLAGRIEGKATKELAVLAKLKRGEEGGSGEILGWDRPYYMQQALDKQFGQVDLSAYLSLGNCLEGLNMITQALFGMELRRAAGHGRAWSDEVVVLDCVDETKGLVGVVYLDLFSRAPLEGAQYVIQSSKVYESGERQVPTTTLVCNFVPRAGWTHLLSMEEAMTLFHEMGHALHNVLSETELHHLAGTRCWTDFVETPSTLFERFLTDHRVVSRFARHHRTGDVLPAALLERWRRSRQEFAALEMQTQVLFAAVDQAYHGEATLTAADTTRVLEEMTARYSSVPFVPGTHWQTRFAHLPGYPSTYYSYLLARVHSAHIWNTLFAHDPLSRSAGERWKAVLAKGGTDHPYDMICDLLQAEPSSDALMETVLEEHR